MNAKIYVALTLKGPKVVSTYKDQLVKFDFM